MVRIRELVFKDKRLKKTFRKISLIEFLFIKILYENF